MSIVRNIYEYVWDNKLPRNDQFFAPNIRKFAQKFLHLAIHS